jgi:hypothetical protein
MFGIWVLWLDTWEKMHNSSDENTSGTFPI